MPVSLDEFTRQLAASGLIPAAEWQAFLETLPHDRKTDGEQLARELVRQKKLTGFQAQQIYAGKGKALQMGNYTILDKLGQGGMGVVLKARHNRMQRFVAIKVLTKALVKDAEAIARFQREVVAASQLEHPNIVGAYDADEVNGQHILVMQYIEGSDLSSIVKRQGPLPLHQALDCLRQAARGLEYAHKRGVIHRDIKPANLLLDNEGMVKILDMGLARFSDSANIATQAELTGTGTVMGTVDYMSPEQALNTKSADARSDIYSLGISLYYLLTGQAAYPGDSLMARLMAHANSPIPSLRSSRPDVPDAVQALFARAVAKQPGDRYQTMTELAADLGVCLTGLADQQANQTAQQINQTSISFSDDSVPSVRTIAAIPSGGGTKAVTARTAVSRAEYSMQEQGFKDFEAAVSRASGADAFEQTHVSQPTSATLPSISFHRPLSRSAPKGRSWTGGRTLIATGAAAILLLAAIVFFIPTRDGVIRVEINDPEIAVAIKGTEIVLQQADQGKDIKLSPGEKTLVVRRDDFQFETGKLILKKGDAVTVRVELLDGDVTVSAGNRVLGQQTLPTPARETAESPALPAAGTVDLLPLVRTDAPTSSPPWTRESGTIMIPSTAYGRALIDAPLPTDYELHVDVEPLEGKHSLVLGLATPRGRFWIPVSGWGDDKDGSKGATQIEPPPVGGSGVMKSQGRVLFTNKPSRLVATVHPDHVVLVCDGKTLIDWHGDATKGGEWGLWKLPEPAKLGIGAWQSKMRITRLELRPLSPPQTSATGRHPGETVAEQRPPLVAPPPAQDFALKFDGVDDRVEIPSLKNWPGNAHTVEARVESNGTTGMIFRFQDENRTIRALNVLPGRLRGAVFSSTKAETSTQSGGTVHADFSQANRFIHVALCTDGAVTWLYVDGKQAGEYRADDAHQPWTPQSATIGGVIDPPASLDKTSLMFAGRIDELRVSSVVRYDKDFPPPRPGDRFSTDPRTLALYHFDEGRGTQLTDASGNGHHGKIVGATWVRLDPALPASTDLLSLVDPQRDSLGPDKWKRVDNNALENPSVGQWPTLQIPFTPPADYALDLEIERLPGGRTTGSAELGLIVGGRPALLILDAGEISALEFQGLGFANSENPTLTRRPLFPVGEVRAVHVEVRSRSVRVAVDRQLLIDWSGDPATLSVRTEGAALDLSRLWIRAYTSNSYRWRSLRLTPLPAESPAPANSGRVLKFDGDLRGGVQLPERIYDGSHPLTVEAWARPAIVPPEKRLYHLFATPLFCVDFDLNARGWFLQTRTEKTDFLISQRSAPLEAEAWTHVAGILDGQSLTLFVNGVKQFTKPLDSPLLDGSRIGSPFAFWGDGPEGGRHRFHGLVGEARLSRSIRYTEDFTPPRHFASDADTLALYRFDEGTGTIAKDSSGHNHHGRIVGAKWARVDEPRAAATDPSVAVLTGPELFDVLTNDEKWQWSEPENMGSAINAKDSGAYAPAVSGDGLTLVFHSARPGSGGKWDLWMSRRNRPDEPFSPPENLGPQVNSTEADYSPWLSYDGLTLLFITQRGANRIGDVWMTTRPATDQPFSPASPVPGNVNSTSSETGAALSGDGRMLIVSSSSGGNEDLGQSTRPDLQSPFGKVTHLTGDINSSGVERYPWLSSDGRFLLFTEEPVQEGEQSEPAKIWAAVRTDVDAPFGPRARVSIPVPKESSNGARAASATADGRQVFFFANNANNSRNSDRKGSFDLWVVRREPRPPTTAALRRGVEWALSIGGIVRVNNGPPPGIQSVDELPAIAPRQVRIDIGQNSQVTEAGLAHFQGCREVTWLHLGGSPITDAGLANFKDCHRLTFLALWGANQVTEAGLANFAGVKNLRFLNLDEVGVTDSGLAHFHQCTQLQRLLLKNGRISDAGLAPFADCRDLTELDLNGAKQITAAGLENFLSLSHLQTLGLAETQLTDAFLERLAGIASLKSLNVRGTAVSLPAIEKLHARLPRCRIESEFGILEGASEPRGSGL